MSAKYAIAFTVLSLGAAVSTVAGAYDVWVRAAFSLVALAFATVAAAYATGRPRLLPKRDDGSQPAWGWLILWPYFLLARFSFRLYCVTHRRDVAVAEAAPGLWFGRRLTAAEARTAGARWAGVLDLAAEFPRVRVKSAHYRSLPLLDGASPGVEQLREAVAWVTEQLRHGPVLVHCALGHGRTGSVVLAWLLTNGRVPDLAAGKARLRVLRKGFGLSFAQAARVEQFVNAKAASEATVAADSCGR